MSKILITGSTGMLGRYVKQDCLDGTNDVLTPGRDLLNLNEPEAWYLYLKQQKPDVVLHLAAETDVELCQKDQIAAKTRNVDATDSIARACGEMKIWMGFISSCMVFGRVEKNIYNESDEPSPPSYYGQTKLLAEEAIKRYCAECSLIVRAGWMIGGGPDFDHKFVGKIISQMRQNGDGIKAVGDRYGTITKASDLARFVVDMAKLRQTGVYHYASLGVATRYDIARTIGDLLRYKGGVQSVPSSMFQAAAPRPRSEAITSLYLKDLGVKSLPHSWQEDLATYVNEFVK